MNDNNTTDLPVANAVQTVVMVQLGTLTANSPTSLVEGATKVATVLADVIRSQGLSLQIKGKEYVKVEGWTTLATMLGVMPREVQTTVQDGVYTSVVELVRMSDAVCISRASAECGAPDELDSYGNPLWAKRPAYARRSMSQTRATGKACRLAFSWIMKLAGYEATPAEEMEPIAATITATNTTTVTSSKPNTNEYYENLTKAHDANFAAGRVTTSITPIKPEAITEPQYRRLEARIKSLGLNREAVKNWVLKMWGIQNFQDIPKKLYQYLDRQLDDWAKEKAEVQHEVNTRESDAKEAKEQQAKVQAAKAQKIADLATKQFQWNGRAEDLIRVVAKMKQEASDIEHSARYAEGNAYQSDMERINYLLTAAHELESQIKAA